MGEICSSGKCEGGSKDCSFLDDQCKMGQCEVVTGACIAEPKVGSCNDSDVCTFNDQCQNGSCVGTLKDCMGLDS